MTSSHCPMWLLNGSPSLLSMFSNQVFPLYNGSLLSLLQFSSVQSLSHVWLFAIPWTAAHQASLSITISWSPPKPMSIQSVVPSNHLILCRPLLLLPSIFPSIKVFSNESALCIRWSKYWHFSFNISPSNEHPGLISFMMDWLDFRLLKTCLTSSWTVTQVLGMEAMPRLHNTDSFSSS